jgi:hypothetical protein
MASDGDRAPRSAARIVSFDRFGLVTQVGLAGSDVVLLATGDYLGDTPLCRAASRRLPKKRGISSCEKVHQLTNRPVALGEVPFNVDVAHVRRSSCESGIIVSDSQSEQTIMIRRRN